MKNRVTLRESDLRRVVGEALRNVIGLERSKIPVAKRNNMTEERVARIVREVISETSKIRPWTNADYYEVNPLQQVDPDFAGIKDSDIRYYEKEGEVRDSTEPWREADKKQKIRINKTQTKLTDKLQQELLKTYGDNCKFMFYNKEMTMNKKLSEELAKYGMKMQISGKTFSYGNTKLPENTLVINLTSAFNCPSMLAGECAWGPSCYGHKMENRYDSVAARNLRNENFLELLGTKGILELVETYIESAPVRIRYIRLHEVGDFRDQSVFDFCDKLAGHLKAKYGIRTVAYTHRRLDYTTSKNIIVNASSYGVNSGDRYFMVVKKNDWDKIPEGLNFDGKDIPMVSAENGEKIDTTHGTFKCHCDCRKCRFCYNTKQENGEPSGNMVTVIETEH